MRIPKVRYADADGVSIAYEVRGEGPHDVVRISSVFPSLLARSLVSTYSRGDDALANFARLVFIDRRGIGMSDRSARDRWHRSNSRSPTSSR
jgi:pimeloyl-ACP methyl ester carboxylesterase